MPPKKFNHRFMYIAPSSGEPLPNLNLPLKWILRRFDVVLSCLKSLRMLHFLKQIDENPLKSANTVEPRYKEVGYNKTLL